MLNSTNIILSGLLTLLFVAATATAQNDDGNPANWCRNGLFVSDGAEFKVAKVGGNRAARIHFLNDDENCPNTDAKCEMKSYLITGDEVLVSKKFGSWVCAWYQPQKGSETVGWLPIDKLVVSAPSTSPALEKWVGFWKYDKKTLNIRRDTKSGFLKVEGYAIWQGLGTNVHVGGIEAVAQPEGDELVLVEEECRVSVKLVGDYLVTGDNAGCGGVNVRLNGVYRRAAIKAPKKR